MVLKVGFFSDLHTEFLKLSAQLTPKDRRLGRIYSLEDFAAELAAAYAHCDVVVAAGDIGNGDRAIGFLKMAFPEKPVIFTPGNHEFWCGELFSTHSKMAAACEGTNIHYLPAGELVEIQGVVFCGGTLWTDYKLTNSPHALSNAENQMNDFRKIRILKGAGGRLGVEGGAYAKIKPGHLAQFHNNQLKRIKEAMAEALAADKILVVVTHHAPSAKSLWFDSEREAMSGMKGFGYQPTDPCYASHLDYLFKGEEAPNYWIHGHTHVAVDYRVGNTRIVSNPKGYAEGDETGWVAGRYLEIPT